MTPKITTEEKNELQRDLNLIVELDCRYKGIAEGINYELMLDPNPSYIFYNNRVKEIMAQIMKDGTK